MKKWWELALTHATPILLGAYTAALTLAAWLQRPLYSEGAPSFFIISGLRQFHWDPNVSRYLSTILQIPVVAFLKMSSHLPANPYWPLLYHLPFTLHPIISLAVCWQILKKHNRRELFCFPVLSFALCTAAVLPSSLLVVPETLSFFWPLFFGVLLRQGDSFKAFILCFLGIFILSFGYETAVLLQLIIGMVLVYRILQNSSPQKKYDHILLIGVGISIGYFFWRMFGPYGPSNKKLLSTVAGYNFLSDFFAHFCIGISLLVLLELIIRGRRSAWDKVINVVTPLGSAVMLALFLPKLFEIYHPNSHLYSYVFFDRVFVIPFACGFILLCFWQSIVGASALKRLQTPGMLALAACALAGSLARDLVLTKEWNAAYTKVQELKETYPGCNVISRQAFLKIFGHWSVGNEVNFPSLSIGLESGKEPTSIFFVEETHELQPCIFYHLWMPFIHGAWAGPALRQERVRFITLQNDALVSTLVERSAL